MKHKALKKIEGGKSTQRVNIQKQKIKVQKLHLELLEKLQQHTAKTEDEMKNWMQLKKKYDILSVAERYNHGGIYTCTLQAKKIRHNSLQPLR